MSITVRYFHDPSGQLGSFVEDFICSFDAAVLARDDWAKDHLRSLWLDHLEVQLKIMTANQFDSYFATRMTWRRDGIWQVVKTPDLPCVAYTAQINSSGLISIHALGAAYRYPDSRAEAWWTDVICPRLRSL